MTTKAYKAFNSDLTCLNFQYEIGKTYEQQEKVEICKSGFHACANPLDVLNYYNLTNSRFCKVTLHNDIVTHSGDSKLASNKITIDAEMNLHEYINSAVKYLVELCATAGPYSHSATAGDYSHSATAGDYSHSATAGNDSRSATAGPYSHSATAGHRSHSATAGHRSHSATAGNDSHSATAGPYSRSATAGNDSHSATAGHRSHSATAGLRSISCALGKNSKVKAGKGGFLIAVEYDDNDNIICIKSGKIGSKSGGKRLRANTWYMVKDGKFVVCEE